MPKLPRGYDFYFDDGELLLFPITPAELTIKSGSRNETIDLINDGEINILKSPSLIEVEFEARFPMREYPYSRIPLDFQTYFDKFTELKTQKKPFRFIVSRIEGVTETPYETNLLVALEDFATKESADEGDDIICTFKLKQYKSYGVQTIATDAAVVKHALTRDNDSAIKVQNPYYVRETELLWNIAKKAYGDGSKWKLIYDANKTVIEESWRRFEAENPEEVPSTYLYPVYPITKLILPDPTEYKATSLTETTDRDTNLWRDEISTINHKNKIKCIIKCPGQYSYFGRYTVDYYYNEVKKSISVTLEGSKNSNGHVNVAKLASREFMADNGRPITVTAIPTENIKMVFGSPLFEGYHRVKVTANYGEWKFKKANIDVPMLPSAPGVIATCNGEDNCSITITYSEYSGLGL